MSTDAKGERPLGAEIDALFKVKYGRTTKGRIELAAHILSTSVHRLDMVEDQGQRPRERGISSLVEFSLRTIGYPSSLVEAAVSSTTDESEKTGVERILELFEDDEERGDEVSFSFSPIEKAKLALTASSDGARAVHGLSLRQVNRAIALARKRSL